MNMVKDGVPFPTLSYNKLVAFVSNVLDKTTVIAVRDTGPR